MHLVNLFKIYKQNINNKICPNWLHNEKWCM